MMRDSGMRGFFVTGTDTGVGKTLVACALLRAATTTGLRAVGMKPVAAGCRQTDAGLRNDDALALLAAGNVSACYEDVNPVALPLATSPEIAARAAGIKIDIGHIHAAYKRLAARADCVIVEGAGGWYAPIDPNATMADCARTIGLPVVLVVNLRLGCLNHARLSMEAIARAHLPLAAVVANGVSGDPALAGYVESLTTSAGITTCIAIPLLQPTNIDVVAMHLRPIITATAARHRCD